VSAEFLDRLASQLKVDKDPISRPAIERVLDAVKKGYAVGQYAVWDTHSIAGTSMELCRSEQRTFFRIFIIGMRCE